jgi:hypothetical protein
MGCIPAHFAPRLATRITQVEPCKTFDAAENMPLAESGIAVDTNGFIWKSGHSEKKDNPHYINAEIKYLLIQITSVQSNRERKSERRSLSCMVYHKDLQNKCGRGMDSLSILCQLSTSGKIFHFGEVHTTMIQASDP